MEEIHYGGEGPHWAVVPMKKKYNLREIGGETTGTLWNVIGI